MDKYEAIMRIVILFTALLSAGQSAFAAVSVEDAMFYAVGKMAVLGLLAYGWYKLLTRSLPVSDRTPSQQGRYIGAWLSALSVLNYTKGTLPEQIATVLIMLPVWFLIGYGLGFAYKKIKG